MRVSYCGEAKWVDFDSQGRDVLLLELSGDVTLHESSLEWLAVLAVHIEVARAITAQSRGCTPRRLGRCCPGRQGRVECLTLPVPPSPTRTSLKVGGACAAALASAMVAVGCGVVSVNW